MSAGLNLLKLDSGRQELVAGEFKLGFADLLGQSGNKARGIWLPEGATLHSVQVVVDTAWNSASSDTLTIKDEADNTIVAATSIAAISRFAATEANLGQRRSTVDYLGLIWTGVSTAPTAGSLTVIYTYTQDDKDLFNHGLDGFPNTGHA